MPVMPLPPNPNVDHLKSQARDLLKAHASRELQAAQRIREFHPRFQKWTDAAIFDTRFRLSDAQLTIARERGFASWARLKRRIEKPTVADRLDLPHHERIENLAFRHAVDLLDQGDVVNLRAHLNTYPHLVRERVTFEGGNYFRHPTLLEFVAENPVRHASLPDNIVEVAKVILDAGAKAEQSALNDALGLVATGCVPRECHVQLPLIDLLCAYGAEPTSAALAALAHGELEAADALLRNGARIDLVIAAGLGHIDAFQRFLPASTDEERQRALALASQHGHAAIVRLLLDGGCNPNRYNPVGFHAHSTPLHQAAARGHVEVVRLLVEHGARPEMKDTTPGAGTPASWARHEGHKEIAEYLQAQTRAGLEGIQPD